MGQINADSVFLQDIAHAVQSKVLGTGIGERSGCRQREEIKPRRREDPAQIWARPSRSPLSNAHGLNKLSRSELPEHGNPAQTPLCLDSAHNLVRDLADNCDIAGKSQLGRTVLRLHTRYANHRDDLEDHLFNRFLSGGSSDFRDQFGGERDFDGH
jgi:hypothetical protein